MREAEAKAYARDLTCVSGPELDPVLGPVLWKGDRRDNDPLPSGHPRVSVTLWMTGPARASIVVQFAVDSGVREPNDGGTARPSTSAAMVAPAAHSALHERRY